MSHKASIKKWLSDLSYSWRAPLIGTLVSLLCIQPCNYVDVMIYMWGWMLFHMKCCFVHLLGFYVYLHLLIPAQCWHSTETMQIRSKLKLSYLNDIMKAFSPDNSITLPTPTSSVYSLTTLSALPTLFPPPSRPRMVWSDRVHLAHTPESARFMFLIFSPVSLVTLKALGEE